MLDWLTFPVGAGAVGSGDSSIVTAEMPPGNYLVLCYIPSPDGKPHVVKGMYRRLVVVSAAPGAVRAEEPKAGDDAGDDLLGRDREVLHADRGDPGRVHRYKRERAVARL